MTDREAAGPMRTITVEICVPAELPEVWQAWTTEEGVRTFFAQACKIELRPGGPYEMYFLPEGQEGTRGGEGCRVLAVQAQQMLSFTWNAPPSLSEVRGQYTHVVVRFREDPQGTCVTLIHDGWGKGGEWDQAFGYFDAAWKRVVLPRLKYRFEHGPVDWDHLPDLNI